MSAPSRQVYFAPKGGPVTFVDESINRDVPNRPAMVGVAPWRGGANETAVELGTWDSVPRFAQPALCAEVDPDVFDPDVGQTMARAKVICRMCDARAECLQWALDHDERGLVWGGLTDRERNALRAGPRQQRERPISHGKEGGYRTHIRRGEKPCDECKRSNTEKSQRHRGRLRNASEQAS